MPAKLLSHLVPRVERPRPLPARSSIVAVDDLTVQAYWRPIRHGHLRVRPPDGQVVVSMPLHVGDEQIRAFVRRRRAWIDRARLRARQAPSAAPLRAADLVPGATVPVWGEPCTLAIAERSGRPHVVRDGATLHLVVRPGTTPAGRAALLARWQREEVLAAARPLVALWQARIGVTAGTLSVRAMRSRWGSCTVRSGDIRLALALATRRRDGLEYVVVHELVHLLESGHTRRFWRLVAAQLPDGAVRRRLLNRPPQVGAEMAPCTPAACAQPDGQRDG